MEKTKFPIYECKGRHQRERGELKTDFMKKGNVSLKSVGLSLVCKFHNPINLMVLDFFPVDLSLEVMNSGQLAKNDWHPGKTETKEIPLYHHIFPALPLPQTWQVPAGIAGWQRQWVICLGDWGTPWACNNCSGVKCGGFGLQLY